MVNVDTLMPSCKDSCRTILGKVGQLEVRGLSRLGRVPNTKHFTVKSKHCIALFDCVELPHVWRRFRQQPSYQLHVYMHWRCDPSEAGLKRGAGSESFHIGPVP